MAVEPDSSTRCYPCKGHCHSTIPRSKGHCLVVVAEGCGDTLLQSSGEVDGGLAAASSEPGTVLFG